MELLKRLTSWLEIERELEYRFGVDVAQVFTFANTNYILSHNLQRVPKGWQCVDKNTYGVFKRITWDKTTITLQCNTASTTATIRVF